MYICAVVILSTRYDNKLLEHLKTGFERTIKWNKYKWKMSKQNKTNKINYSFDLTFIRVNTLFVSTF